MFNRIVTIKLKEHSWSVFIQKEVRAWLLWGSLAAEPLSLINDLINASSNKLSRLH